MRRIMIIKQDEALIGKRINRIVDSCLEIDIGGVKAGLL